MKPLQFALVLATAFFTSCVGTHVSGNDVRFSHKVEVIVVSPSGGATSDAIVQKMLSYAKAGTEVKTASETTGILARLDIPSASADEPTNLRKLQSAGVDGFMRITSILGPARGDAPRRVTIRLYSTQELGSVIEFVWENTWTGTTAGQLLSASLTAVAEEIADKFLSRL
jgi:hypothetical protein